MSVLNQREFGVRRVEWLELFGRIGVTSAGYPMEYVKVLIQIGHEPMPPRETTTLLGKPALALPGFWAYMKHIKKTDGFFGLYRGLAPRLCTNLVSGFIYTTMLDRLPAYDEVNNISEGAEEELTDEQKILRFVHELIRMMVSRCAAVLASHPLHIITIRTMAQFIGREEKYCGIYGSLKEIYKESGMAGYFSGLVPRILGEILTLLVANTVSFGINTFIIEEKALKTYTQTVAVYISSAMFYPFVVVSNCICVNNCGLAAGMPPNMPLYKSWTDCWSHLSALGQLKRGSTILWRYYHGPWLKPKHESRKF